MEWTERALRRHELAEVPEPLNRGALEQSSVLVIAGYRDRVAGAATHGRAPFRRSADSGWGELSMPRVTGDTGL